MILEDKIGDAEHDRTDPYGVIERLRCLTAPRPSDAIGLKLFNRLLRKTPDKVVLPEPALIGITREARGLVITGPTGAGKSTLVEKMFRDHPAFPGFRTPGSSCKVRSFTVKSPASLKSLGLDILDQLGWQENQRATDGKIWRAVNTRLVELGYSVIHLDEGQRVAQNKSDLEIKNVCDTWISLLQQPNPMVVVLSGVETLLSVVNNHEQCFRRFTKLSLPPLTVADIDDIAGAIAAYCAEAQITFMDDEDLILRLIHATRSAFGLAMEHVIDAIAEALEAGDDVLTRQHFADAYGFRTGCLPHLNPFIVEAWASVPIGKPADDEDEDEMPISKKRKRS